MTLKMAHWTPKWHIGHQNGPKMTESEPQEAPNEPQGAPNEAKSYPNGTRKTQNHANLCFVPPMDLANV